MTAAGLATPPAPTGPGAAFHFEEAVPRTAATWRRFFATLTDFLLITALSWAVALGAIAAGYSPPLLLVGPDVEPLVRLAVLMELPLNVAYFTVLEGTLARTPGKLLFGARVARMDGTAPDLLDAFVRTLLRVLWVTPGIGQLFLLLDAYLVHSTEMEQRIGDLAAGTVVVEDTPT